MRCPCVAGMPRHDCAPNDEAAGIYLGLANVPASTSIRLAPVDGVVDHARLGITSQDEGIGFALEADDLDFVLQFDPDGDTRYKGLLGRLFRK